MRPSLMEVSVDNLRYNIKSIRSKLSENTKIMPILKANAYGTFINTRPDLLEEFDIAGVALVEEGVELRKCGFKREIFVINPCYVEEIDDIINYNLTISVSDEGFIKALGERNDKVKVHIEIETGMSRTGVNINNLNNFIDLIFQYKNIEIEGMYTHMSSAGVDKEYTERQIRVFRRAIEIMKERNIDLRYIHMCASNGIVNFPEAHFNLVRPGMILYGYESTKGISKKIDLRPVCRLKSKITFLKTVDPGTSIGYMRTHITDKETKVATIPIGYADGVKRILSNRGFVYINGVKAPIIGNLCMDSFMADVTEVPDVQVGSDVWIWDNENITVYDLAEKCYTTDYEIITSITARIPRVYI